MADLEAAAWSETAANNIQPSPDGWPSLSSPNIVYTTDREMMGALKRDWNRRNATVTAGGTANALTLSFTVNPTVLVQGQRYAFIAAAANTGPATLQVGALAATAIQVNGAALVGGELRTGLITDVIYTGSVFAIIAGSGAGSGAYLPLAGGTLSGPIALDNTVASGARVIYGRTTGSLRWAMYMGNAVAESAGNVGSDWILQRFDNTGTFLDQPVVVTRSSGAVAIKGDPSGNAAAVGLVGEIVSSNVTSPVGLPTGVGAGVAAITLTPGDWNVSGEVWFNIGVSASYVIAGIGPTAGAFPASSTLSQARAEVLATLSAGSQVLALRTTPVAVAASTTYWLNAQTQFGSGSCTATGNIWARRAR